MFPKTLMGSRAGGFAGVVRGVGSGWRSGTLAGAFEEAMGWYSFREKRSSMDRAIGPWVRIFDHTQDPKVPAFFMSTFCAVFSFGLT